MDISYCYNLLFIIPCIIANIKIANIYYMESFLTLHDSLPVINIATTHYRHCCSGSRYTNLNSSNPNA